MFGVREGSSRYRVRVEWFADRIVAPRKDRADRIAEYAQRYADRLEHHCRIAPLQWFNFYDFWEPTEGRARIS
jgi:predicted LPLAT superfamily acyltransferase